MSAALQTLSEAGLTGSRSEALTGDIEVPGDKSMSHRALILGALARGETRISGLLEGDDVLHTAEAVRAFGAEVERVGPGEWRVQRRRVAIARRRRSTAATAAPVRAC